MRNERRIWTEEDDENLRGLYMHEPIDLIAMELERTQHACRQRAMRIGIRRPENWDKAREQVRS
jgi:hypothetical protein